MGYQHRLYAVDDRVATMTLNLSERRSALSQPLVNENTEHFLPDE